MENCTMIGNNSQSHKIFTGSMLLLQTNMNISGQDIDPNLSHGSSKDTLNSLSPAFFQCFGIMLLGYIAGRTKFVSMEDSKGINAFLGKIALPVLIFCALCTLDFSTVNWTFFVSVLITKSTLFMGTLIIALAVTKGSLGKAGLFAIFVSMSNDFALGYPLLKSLYGDTQPEFPVYLYIIAPITLVILNPIGFVFLEVNLSKNESEEMEEENEHNKSFLHKNKTLKIAVGVLKGLLKNPILIMTILGITIGRLIVNHDGQLPVLIRPLLECLSASFAAPALFLCGLSMVGRINSIKGGTDLLTVVLLIAGKIFVTPLVGRLTTSMLMHFHDDNSAKDIQELSDFSFLYGTFPACPTMYIYATKYGIAPEPVTTAMIFSIFLSVPWMFVSAQFLSLDVILSQVETNAESFATVLSILSMMATMIMLIKWIMKKNEKSETHFPFLFVLITQLFINATFLFSTLVYENETMQYSTTLLGFHSNKIYITNFLFTLLLSSAWIKQSWISNTIKFVFLLCGIVIPFIFVTTFNILPENKNIMKCDAAHSNLRNNFPTYLSLFTTILLLPIQAFCLIMLATQNSNTDYDSNDVKTSLDQALDVEKQHLVSRANDDSMYGSNEDFMTSKYFLESLNNNSEPTYLNGSSYEYLQSSLSCQNCDDTKNDTEQESCIQMKEESIIEIKQQGCPEYDSKPNFSTVYFFLIVIFGGLIEILLCQWNLSNDNVSGIYLILLYLHLFFIYGQGILTFLFFFDFSETKEIISSIFKLSKRPSRSDYLEI